MFNNIHIQRFRGISDLKFEDFKQFNLFIGKNNCCKTSALESLFILVNPTAPGLPSKTNRFRGLNIISKTTLELLFHNFNFENPIKIEANLDKIHKKRSLTIKPKFDLEIPSDYPIDSNEQIIMNEQSFQSGTVPNFNGLIFEVTFFNFNNEETTYKSEMFFKKDLKQIMPEEYIEKYKGIFLSPEFFAYSQTVNQFSNLVVEKRKDNVVKILKEIEPSLTDMDIASDNIIFCDLGLEKMLPINVMGSGIYKILSTVLAIEANKDGVIFIDEIENGLSFNSQEILWKAIFASAKLFNVQIFASSHSLECIRALSYVSSGKLPNLEDDVRVYRIEKKEKDFRVVKFNQENIESVIEKGWDIR